MNSPYAMVEEDDVSQPTVSPPARGSWWIAQPVDAQSTRQSPRGCLRPFGIGMVLALSSLTSLADPWVADRKRYTEPTSQALVELTGPRRITLRRARQLALQLLADIERARLQAAHDEACKAFDIEEIG